MCVGRFWNEMCLWVMFSYLCRCLFFGSSFFILVLVLQIFCGLFESVVQWKGLMLWQKSGLIQVGIKFGKVKVFFSFLFLVIWWMLLLQLRVGMFVFQKVIIVLICCFMEVWVVVLIVFGLVLCFVWCLVMVQLIGRQLFSGLCVDVWLVMILGCGLFVFMWCMSFGKILVVLFRRLIDFVLLVFVYCLIRVRVLLSDFVFLLI